MLAADRESLVSKVPWMVTFGISNVPFRDEWYARLV